MLRTTSTRECKYNKEKKSSIAQVIRFPSESGVYEHPLLSSHLLSTRFDLLLRCPCFVRLFLSRRLGKGMGEKGGGGGSTAKDLVSSPK